MQYIWSILSVKCLLLISLRFTKVLMKVLDGIILHRCFNVSFRIYLTRCYTCSILNVLLCFDFVFVFWHSVSFIQFNFDFLSPWLLFSLLLLRWDNFIFSSHFLFFVSSLTLIIFFYHLIWAHKKTINLAELPELSFPKTLQQKKLWSMSATPNFRGIIFILSSCLVLFLAAVPKVLCEGAIGHDNWQWSKASPYWYELLHTSPTVRLPQLFPLLLRKWSLCLLSTAGSFRTAVQHLLCSSLSAQRLDTIATESQVCERGQRICVWCCASVAARNVCQFFGLKNCETSSPHCRFYFFRFTTPKYK